MRWGYLAFVAAAWSVVATARADTGPDTGLVDARRALDKLDYAKATTALASALASGAYGHDELAEIYRLRGVVASTLGDKAGAVAAFERLLALDPQATLSSGTSPKITRPFAEATAYFKAHKPLQVTTETASAPPSVTVVVVSDALNMVAGSRAIVAADGKREETRTAPGAARMKLELPAGKRLELRMAVLDEHGNRLIELGSASAPIVITTDVAPPPEVVVVAKPVPPVVVVTPAPHHAIVARWWLWGSVAVGFAAGGTYFGLQARQAGKDLDALNASSRAHDFGEAQAALSRGQRDALISNLGFGIAAGTAVVSAILFATGREHPLPVAPVAMHGGGGVTLEVEF